MSRARNVVVAQSGGPSPVINNSLRGIVEACQSMPDAFGTVYGGCHGIEGVLKEELLDLSAQPPEEIALLRVTPAAGAIGTCRYKLKAKPDRGLRARHRGLQGPRRRLLLLHRRQRLDGHRPQGGRAGPRSAGWTWWPPACPRPSTTTSATPSSSSSTTRPATARWPATGPARSRRPTRRTTASCPADPVLVLQAMGRKIGFIPAAARLADPQREMPLQIYLAESGLTLAEHGRPGQRRAGAARPRASWW